jgi:deoxyribonuclease IV
MQMFSRNPRGWDSPMLPSEEAEGFRIKLEESGISPVFIHTPYILNLASPKDDVYTKSVIVLKDELRRAAELTVPYVVTHLGSHLGYGKAEGFRRIVGAINDSFSSIKNDVILLLENTAGTKNSMGSAFEDIAYILSKIKLDTRVGVCFDTCVKSTF